MPEISGSSHSSIQTFGRDGLAIADHRTQVADHPQNARNTALVKGMNLHPFADQGSGNVGLQVGKRQNQIGLQRQNLWHIGAGKGADTRLFAAHPSWADGISGDPDDPVLLPQKIQRFHCLFGQTDNTLCPAHRFARSASRH
jgi:hypothetical protein